MSLSIQHKEAIQLPFEQCVQEKNRETIDAGHPTTV